MTGCIMPVALIPHLFFVIPAKAGTQGDGAELGAQACVPAFAGMMAWVRTKGGFCLDGLCEWPDTEDPWLTESRSCWAQTSS